MDFTPATCPPPLPTLDTEAFRRKLAGLADTTLPAPGRTGVATTTTLRETAKDLCLVLCRQFGASLDRITLWDKIGAALATACAKVTDGDLERFASLCLETVKAEPGSAAADEGFAAVLATFETWPEETRLLFVQHVRDRSFVVVANARTAWQSHKELHPRSVNGNGGGA